MSNPLIYRARIKELAKTMEMRVSEDAVVATDAKVRAMVQEAAKRAKTNNRKTIQPQDL
jgi:histone H3/H4